MKDKIYLLAIFLFSNITAFTQIPTWQWANGSAGNSYDHGKSITVDTNGDSYVTGYFSSSSITFGGITLTNTNGGSDDIFIVKYDALGNVLWAQSAGGVDDDQGTSIAVDANGNSYITGLFGSDSIAFGNTTLVQRGVNSWDVFVVKYDASGNSLWAKGAGGSYVDEGNDIAVDTKGNAYIIGTFNSDTISFDSITLTSIAGSGDFFVAKYDPSGNVVWAQSSGGARKEFGASITVDLNGFIYATGYFEGHLLKFGTTNLVNVSLGNSSDIFIVKYDSAGDVLWANSAGGLSDDISLSITADGVGNFYLTGLFWSDSIAFDSTTLVNSGHEDIFVVKYDALGNLIWANSAGGNNNDEGHDVVVDAFGNSYITGNFGSSTISFGNNTLMNIGSWDLFVVKYDPSGNVLWAKSTGGIDPDYANSIAVDTNENIFITGVFYSSSIAFGSLTLINPNNLAANVFVAKSGNSTILSEQIISSSRLDIFPNPSNGRFNITGFPNLEEIEIFNLLGQLVYHSNPYLKNISLQIDDDGVYFITIHSQSQTSTRKLVVQH